MFSKDEELLLERIKDQYPDSNMWGYWPEAKIAALVDIYGGHFPDVFQRNNELVLKQSRKLVEYCESERRKFPETKENNEILTAFRKKREAEDIQCRREHRMNRERRYNNHKSFVREDAQLDKDGIVNFAEILAKFMSEPEPDKAYEIKRRDVVFLVEGHALAYPDILRGNELARINGCVMFDPICSYNSDHLERVLFDADEKTQKMVALNIYLAFFNEITDRQSIIEKIILPAFHHLVSKKILKELPKWLNGLNAFTIGMAFVQEIIDTYFAGSGDSFLEARKSLIAKMVHDSNEVSRDHMCRFLDENKEITTVYGLVGSLHLPMLNNAGDAVVLEERHLHIKVKMPNRLVDVHLFGGQHGDMTHCKKMEEFIVKAGLLSESKEIEPSHLPGMAVLALAEKHKSAGNEYYAKKDYAAALSCYAEALKLNPRFKEAFHNTGMCHYFLKNYETAVTFFDKALAIDPNYQNAKTNKAKAQTALEKQPTLKEAPKLK